MHIPIKIKKKTMVPFKILNWYQFFNENIVNGSLLYWTTGVYISTYKSNVESNDVKLLQISLVVWPLEVFKVIEKKSYFVFLI